MAVNNFPKFKRVLNRAFTQLKSNMFIIFDEKFFVGEKRENIG